MIDICVAGCRSTEVSIHSVRATNYNTKQIVDFCTKMSETCSSDEMMMEENQYSRKRYF